MKRRGPEPIHPAIITTGKSHAEPRHLERGRPEHAAWRWLDRLRGVEYAVEPVDAENVFAGEKRIQRRRRLDGKGEERVEHVNKHEYRVFSTLTVYDLKTGACHEYHRFDGLDRPLRSVQVVEDGDGHLVDDYDPELGKNFPVNHEFYLDGQLREKTITHYERLADRPELEDTVQARKASVSEQFFGQDRLLDHCTNTYYFYGEQGRLEKERISQLTMPRAEADGLKPALPHGRSVETERQYHYENNKCTSVHTSEQHYASADVENEAKSETWATHKIERVEQLDPLTHTPRIVRTNYYRYTYPDQVFDRRQLELQAGAMLFYQPSLLKRTLKIESGIVLDYVKQEKRTYRLREANEARDPSSPDEQLIVERVEPLAEWRAAALKNKS